MTLKLIVPSVAVLAISAVSPAARASTPLLYNTGDLLLGFRASTGATGASVDYLLDLGPAATYRNATAPINITGLGDIAADLAANFGASWATSGTVYFAAVAYTGATSLNGDPAQTVYTTNALNASPWPYSSTQSTVGGLIQNVGVKYGSSTSNVKSPVGLLQSITDQNSYGSYQPTGSAGGGISFNQWSPSNEGTVGVTLQLDELINGVSSTEIGMLQVLATGNNSNGEILFSPIPEPSPLALLSFALGGFSLRRRGAGRRA